VLSIKGPISTGYFLHKKQDDRMQQQIVSLYFSIMGLGPMLLQRDTEIVRNPS